jgi:hypothetical protein
VPQTHAEVLVKKIQSEVNRLAPQAIFRHDFSNYKDDGADIYVYAPRKVSDTLRAKLKPILAAELNRAKGDLKARLIMEDMENMSAEAKKKYGVPV